MMCPRCDIEMQVGETISRFTRRNVLEAFRPTYTKECFEAGVPILIECLKCPLCGHSEEKKNERLQ